jgi:transposase
MKAYSDDLRRKIVQAYLNKEGSLRDLAERFSVSLNFVWLLWRRYQATGSVRPKAHAGGQVSVMDKDRLSILRDLVRQQNDATLAELQEQFRQKTGLQVSTGTLSLALKKLGLSRKKKTFHATERTNDPDIIEERAEFRQEMPKMDTRHIVFIDETGTNLGMAREYGWAPEGCRAEGHRPFNPGQNITLIGGLNSCGIVAPLMFPGSLDGNVFKTYVEQILVPELRPGDIVLLDNLSSHKVSGIKDILARAGATLKFLPRYSPELSPIEKGWSKIKTDLRTAAARSYESLVEAVKQALDKISKKDAEGWFEGCGYCIEHG